MSLLILLIWMAMPILEAGELPPPTPRRDREVADELYLRRIHQEWNNLEVTSTNPNSNIRGMLGDLLIYVTGGSYTLCVNTSSGEGTTWRCSANALTAP